MKLPKQQKTFNPKKRRVNRKVIPFTESLSSTVVLMTLLLIIVWVISQKNNFNAEDRDIKVALLKQDKAAVTLYHQPTTRWSENSSFQQPQSELMVFPTSIVSNNWQIKKRIKQFDQGNLFEKINGEAERFLQQNFKYLYYLNLIDGTRKNEIDIELFDQGNLSGSMGIFSEHRSEDNRVKEEQEVIFFETSIGAIGRVENYFFRISSSQQNAITKDKISQILASFSGLSQKKQDTNFGLSLFKDRLNISSSEISHKSQNVFQYDFAKNFWFATPDPQKQGRLFVHQGTDQEAVSALYSQLKNELAFEYTVIDQNPNLLLLQHTFLSSYFQLVKQGTYLYGFENAVDHKNMVNYMEDIKKGLSDEN